MYLRVLVGTYYVFAVASQLVSQHTITCEPLVVKVNRQELLPQLKVDLKPVNNPTCERRDYGVVVYCKKDEKKLTPKMGQCKLNETVTLGVNLRRDWDNCYIAYCLYGKREVLELGKCQLYNVIKIKLQDTEVQTDRYCIANKCELTLDVGNFCKNLNTAVQTHQGQENKDTPNLSVSDTGSGNFDNRRVVTCSAPAQQFDLLSLYQHRTKGKRVLLKMVQYLKDEEGEITIHETVSFYDNGSSIYCVKQKPDNLSYERKSIVQTFSYGDYEYVRQPAARITVEPDNGTAKFSRDKPLSLVCSATAPIPDRLLTWYIRDRNTSELEVIDASSQQYDRATNENRLTLWLNDSYDAKTLFCAQDSHLVVEHAGGRRSVERYGETATSRNITLKLQRETDVEKLTGSSPDLGLVCGAVAGTAALLAVTALVAWWLRRRGAGEGGAPEENQYATIAEVAYAELSLNESSGPAKTQDTSPYAQIVGVYNPRK